MLEILLHVTFPTQEPDLHICGTIQQNFSKWELVGVTMKKSFIVSMCTLVVMLLIGANTVQAAPLELDGLGLETSWIDTEGVDGDMPAPADLWGLSETEQANRIGIWVRYENGLTSWATYSGIDPAEWGTCCTVVATEDSASDWLAGATLHGVGRDDLPMAWVSASNPWTGNFDLDYNSAFGSDWRADSAGWGSVEIALYSNVRAPAPAPEEVAPVPTLGTYSLSLLILLMAGLGWVFFHRN